LSTATVRRIFVFAAVLGLAQPTHAFAQGVAEAAKFIGGGALGLAIHESAHILADVGSGTDPGLKKVTFGPIPFFAITHEAVSPGREFVISSAGFWAQHAVSEWLLSRRPQLRDEHAPLLKGVLAFNVLASVSYSIAAFAQVGPPERDTRGMAMSANVDEPVIGAVVLAPAVLDAMRYYGVRNRWTVWGSRAAKIGGALLVVKAVQ
jgi:hypothetical protein